MQHIHIINGPNLNLLGKREPEIYGTVSFDTFFATLRHDFPSVGLHHMQTNHEGVIIDYLHTHGFEEHTGFILNAGGLSHTSVSLRDAISSVQSPVVEVHLSDIYAREPFRHISLLSDVCVSKFIGFGLEGYKKAIDYLLVVR